MRVWCISCHHLQAWAEAYCGGLPPTDYYYYYYFIIIIIIIIKVSLNRKKNFKNTVHQSTLQSKKKLMQRRFSTVELGKGNSEKMCLQPAPEGAECLWRCDAGWQAVPDARSSDEEGSVTNCRAARCRRYESRRWSRTQPSSCVDVRHTTQLVRQVRRSRTEAVPCRQRNTSTASLNSIRSRTGNQWRSRSSGVVWSYFRK